MFSRTGVILREVQAYVLLQCSGGFYEILLSTFVSLDSGYGSKAFKNNKKTRLESTGTSPGILNLDFDLWTLDFFYGL